MRAASGAGAPSGRTWSGSPPMYGVPVNTKPMPSRASFGLPFARLVVYAATASSKVLQVVGSVDEASVAVAGEYGTLANFFSASFQVCAQTIQFLSTRSSEGMLSNSGDSVYGAVGGVVVSITRSPVSPRPAGRCGPWRG